MATDDEEEALFVFVERDRRRDPDRDFELVRAVTGQVVASLGLKPSRVIVLEPGTLPRTSSGKIRRGETSRRFLEGTLSPPKSVSLFHLAGEMIRSKLASFGE